MVISFCSCRYYRGIAPIKLPGLYWSPGFSLFPAAFSLLWSSACDTAIYGGKCIIGEQLTPVAKCGWYETRCGAISFSRYRGPLGRDMPSQSVGSTQLPSPHERPEADVIIFDGQCQFCRTQVQRLAQWDRKGRLSFLSLHAPDVAQRWPDLTHQQLMEQMYLIDQRGNRYGGAMALRYLTRQLPRLWPLLPLMHIPGSLRFWQMLYRWVARQRYRLSGARSCDEDGTCQIHFRS